MVKTKSLISSALVIAIVALFAATEVLAQDVCTNIVPGITVTFDSLTPQGNGTWLARYLVSGNKVGDITSIDMALDKDVNLTEPSGFHYAYPGEGAAADIKWGAGMWEQRILTGDPMVDPQGNTVFEFFTTSRFTGRGGINVNATKGRNGVCTMTVPIETLPSHASVPSVAIVEVEGVDYCVDVNPATGCPPLEGAFFYRCDDEDKTPIGVDATFQIVSDGDEHGLVRNQGTAGDPRCSIGILVGGSPECYWFTLFGNAYGPLPPGC